MASERFDSIVRTIATLVSRRTVFGGLAGALLALVNLEQGADAPVEAAKRRRKPRRRKCPRKRRCRRRCCPKGRVCRQGVCRKPTRPPQPPSPPGPPGPPPPPPPPGTVYVRPDMHGNGSALAAYATAVGVMKLRNGNDPTSWTFQAGLHRTAPVGGDGCQHSTVLFLAWHRMYLYWFERIVRAASGDPNFGLPYWDYGVAGNRIVPDTFRNPASPLFHPGRNPEVANGQPPSASPQSFSATAALSLTTFYSNGGASFGGGDRGSGALEGSPHNFIHTWVGGEMGRVPTAALDPLFWVHHANIDRLWEVWLRQGGGRANPTNVPLFMNTPFTFFNEQGAAVQMTGAQILDTISQLAYRYDDQPLSSAGMGAMRAANARRRQPKQSIAGATARGAAVRLTARPVAVPITIRPAAVAALAAAKGKARPVTLVIDGLVGHTTSSVVFELYVNKGRNEVARPSSRAYVGSFTLFGTQPGDMSHGAMPIELSFEITKAVTAPRGAAQKVVVTIVPRAIGGTGPLPANTLATIERLVISVAGEIGGATKQRREQRRTPTRSVPARRRKQPAQRRQTGVPLQSLQGHATTNAPSVIPGTKHTPFAINPADAAADQGGLGHAHQ